MPCRNPRPVIFPVGKKYRNLMPRIIAEANMRQAYYLTAKAKRMTPGFLNFKEYAEFNLSRLIYEIDTGQYVQGEKHNFWVFEPKARQITALPFRDRLVQHALCSIIGPIFEKTLLPRTYACRVGMGTHAGVRDLQAEVRRLLRPTADAPGQVPPLYFLKTDFSRFFASIDRAVLHRMIRKKISCAATLRLIEAIVPPDGIGIPIGSLTSQLFANVYAGALDRHLQQTLNERHWYRYMDDVVILGRDPVHLRKVKEEIERFSAEHLGLRFSKWSIGPVSRGINFLGYRIWPTHKLLRRQSVIGARRKIKTYRARGEDARLQKFLAAWLGHAQWADVHHLLKSLELEQAR